MFLRLCVSGGARYLMKLLEVKSGRMQQMMSHQRLGRVHSNQT